MEEEKAGWMRMTHGLSLCNWADVVLCSGGDGGGGSRALGNEIMSSEIRELGNQIEQNRVREGDGSVYRLRNAEVHMPLEHIRGEHCLNRDAHFTGQGGKG